MSPCVAMRDSETRYHSPGVARPRGLLWARRCLGGASTGRNAADSLKRRSQASAEREGSPLPLGEGEGARGRLLLDTRCALGAPGRAARSAAPRERPFLVYTITSPEEVAALLCARLLPDSAGVRSEALATGSLMICQRLSRFGTGRAVCDNKSRSLIRLGAADRLTGTMHATAPLLYSVPDAAKMLAVSRRTLEREIASGRFPRPLKIGRSSRVSQGDVAAYLEKLRAEVRR